MVKQFPISIIIPVKDDKRVFDCINSIDINCEILIFLNGKYDKKIESELKQNKKIKLFKMRKFSFSKFYNLGIKNSSENRIFFMDSDMVFQPGTLRKLYIATKKFPVAKARIKFTYDSFISKIISRAREFTTSRPDLIYIPGPMFRIKVFDKIGLFNEKVSYAADADLKKRLEYKKIKWKNCPDAILIHPPLKIGDDLKSAVNYGAGRAQRRTEENRSWPNFLKESFFYFFGGTFHKGILTGIYLLIWYLFFCFGFIKEKIILRWQK
jgi:glycosyltransferase involved in cell wall biosynthesis